MWIIIIFILIVFLSTFKHVPANSAIIVDRNSHYLKTVRRGFYRFNYSTDEITTQISTYPFTRGYIQISETHDGQLYNIVYSATYKVSNIEHVLESLKSNRRSVNDIIQSCVHTSVANFNWQDLDNRQELYDEINRRLSVNLDSFEIELIKFEIHSLRNVPESYRDKKFAPHISEGIRSIKYK